MVFSLYVCVMYVCDLTNTWHILHAGTVPLHISEGPRGQEGWEGVTEQQGSKDRALGLGRVTGRTVGWSQYAEPVNGGG